MDLHVECEDTQDDEWRHNITIASDHPKHHNVDWVIGFHQYEFETVFRLTTKHSENFV